MGIEIERKFLVTHIDMEKLEYDHNDVFDIEQIYLKESGVRLRKIIQPLIHGQPRYILTIKEKTDDVMVRREVEIDLTESEYKELCLFNKTKLYKTRYVLPTNDRKLKWELDVFKDRELILLEIELPNKEHPVPVRPKCIGTWKEVTGEPKYINSNLAVPV